MTVNAQKRCRLPWICGEELQWDDTCQPSNASAYHISTWERITQKWLNLLHNFTLIIQMYAAAFPVLHIYAAYTCWIFKYLWYLSWPESNQGENYSHITFQNWQRVFCPERIIISNTRRSAVNACLSQIVFWEPRWCPIHLKSSPELHFKWNFIRDKKYSGGNLPSVSKDYQN